MAELAPVRLRVAFFGMTGRFSTPPLQALLAAGFDVRAVVLPALDAGVGLVPIPPRGAVGRGRAPLPMAGRHSPPDGQTITQIAHHAHIAVYEAGRLGAPATLHPLAGLELDAICVACFNRRIPHAVLTLPRLGVLNIHPALLPDNRGPDPLFWTFWRGDHQTGVTVHLMDERLDAGPIVTQRMVEVPEGITEEALERRLAELGGTLLVEALRGLAAGTLQPRPQDERRATSYPLPTPEDYVITAERPARWAYTFARGVGAREQPIVIAAGERTFRLIEPLGYDIGATLDAPYTLEGDVLRLRCSPGTFTARVARE